jgi:hypothetical protein
MSSAKSGSSKSRSSSGSSSGSPKKVSLKRGSRAQNVLLKLQDILYEEMYTVGAASVEELWELFNPGADYIPDIHHVIVTVEGQQYIFRENVDKTEIFGCKLKKGCKLLKLNKEEMEIE